MIFSMILMIWVECLRTEVMEKVGVELEIDIRVNYAENMATQLLIARTSLIRRL